MLIGLINGSPKTKNSNSEYLLSELKTLIPNTNEIIEFDAKRLLSFDDYDKMLDCDAIVFAFPIYVDGIPSHLLNTLVELEEHSKLKNTSNTMVYTIANCGFYEGSQNGIAIEMMKHWCKKCNLTWGQGIGTGAGEMIGTIRDVPLGYGPKKNLGKALDILANNILENQRGKDLFISPNFPRFAFKIAGNMFWNSKAKSNGLKKNDLFKKHT
ncbi:MAG: hypothetical protein ACRDA3_11080 [Peptostreptococcaceae bacterium]